MHTNESYERLKLHRDLKGIGYWFDELTMVVPEIDGRKTFDVLEGILERYKAVREEAIAQSHKIL